MNALTLSHRSTAGVLSVALLAGVIGFTVAAYAGEETTWYDKWPDIQAQLSPQVADAPVLAAQEPRIAAYSGALRTGGGPVTHDVDPLIFDDVRLADSQIASPYDAPWFDRNPG